MSLIPFLLMNDDDDHRYSSSHEEHDEKKSDSSDSESSYETSRKPYNLYDKYHSNERGKRILSLKNLCYKTNSF